jgi:hypothetical protein
MPFAFNFFFLLHHEISKKKRKFYFLTLNSICETFFLFRVFVFENFVAEMGHFVAVLSCGGRGGQCGDEDKGEREKYALDSWQTPQWHAEPNP